MHDFRFLRPRLFAWHLLGRVFENSFPMKLDVPSSIFRRPRVTCQGKSCFTHTEPQSRSLARMAAHLHRRQSKIASFSRVTRWTEGQTDAGRSGRLARCANGAYKHTLSSVRPSLGPSATTPAVVAPKSLPAGRGRPSVRHLHHGIFMVGATSALPTLLPRPSRRRTRC